MNRPPPATAETVQEYAKYAKALRDPTYGEKIRKMLERYPVVLEPLDLRFVMEDADDLAWLIRKFESAIERFLHPGTPEPQRAARLLYDGSWIDIVDEADIAWFEAKLRKARARLERDAKTAA